MEDIVETPPGEALRKAAQARSPFRKLYYWTLHWADTQFAVPALCLVSFANASFFPVPPDALLLPMCFAQPRKWLGYAFWCTLAAVLGGVASWLIGYYLWETLSGFFLQWLPDLTAQRFEQVRELFQRYGFWVIVFKDFTPIPFKVLAIGAGICQVPLETVILASIISRGARYFLFASLVRLFGDRVKPFLEKYLDQILLGGFVLFVAAILILKFLSR